MRRRVPFMVVASSLVAGAAVVGVGSSDGDESRRAGTRVAPAEQLPAVPPSDVLGSTWYCAAGTADDGAEADHTVLVFNPGEAEVTGTVRVFTGEIAGPASESNEPGGADRDDGEDGAEQPADPSADGDTDDESSAEGQPNAAGDQPAANDRGRQSVGDPWPPTGETGRTPAQQDIRVPAGGQVALRLGDLQAAPLAAALVEADGAVVATHEVRGPRGRDVGPCASSASRRSHLAWGATTRDARELLVLFNPFPSPAAVDIVFSTDDGIREPVRFQGLPVPSGSVVGVDVGEEVTRREVAAATIRSRSGPVVAERLQSFDGTLGLEGLSLGLAAPEPLQAWGFAHGRVGSGWGEQIVLYNADDERAEVDVTVWPSPDDAPGPTPVQPFGVTIAPGRHAVIDYGDEARVPPDVGHATVVRSRNGVGVVAERVLTHRATDGGDIAATTGAASAADVWTFPALGDDEGAGVRLVVYNPDPERTARISVAGQVDGSEVAPEALQSLELPPNGRREIPLADQLDVGSAVLQLRSDAPVIAERQVISPDGVGQAAGPGIPLADSAIPLDRLDLGG